MTATMNILPARKPSLENISLLSVSSEGDDCESLKAFLSHSRWIMHEARSLREALRFLKELRPALVLCERNLPDGNWKDLYGETTEMAPPPAVVVVSPQPDEHLWAEVLSIGCFDLLLRPFDMNEVSRVLNMALRFRPLSRFPYLAQAV